MLREKGGRVVVLLVVVLTCIAVALASENDRYFPIVSGDEPRAGIVSIARPTVGRLEAQISVPGVLAGTAPTARGLRGRIRIEGGGVLSGVGQPALPVLRYLVEVPHGARVTAALAVRGSSTLSLREVAGVEAPLLAVQPPLVKLPGASVPFTEDAKLYAQDSLFPSERVAVVDRGIVRGREVVLVEVRPVRYNPARGIVEIATDSVLEMTYAGGAQGQAARDASRLRSPMHDAWLSGTLLSAAEPSPAAAAPGSAGPETAAEGPGTDGAGGGAAQGAEGLFVVVNDTFYDAIQPLVEWKKKSGYKVEVLKTSQLGGTPTDTLVKNAIQSRYDTWSNPSLGFVLMVGDTDFTPIHQGNGGGNSQVTDNWYACVDGTDYLPDLAIARISTRTAAETQTVVGKLMTYEKATFAASSWVKKAGFIGTEDSGHIGLIEGTHDWCIDNYMTPNGYQQTSWSHGKPSSDRHYNSFSATTAQISSSINEGRSIVNYSGHGSTTSWAGPVSGQGYTQANVNANTNAGMYPFVISNACLTNSLQVSECFGETWQKAADKGAIAFWGASNNSYWDEDDYLQRSLYGRIFPMDSTPAIGIIVNQTKFDLYTHYGATNNVAYYYDMYTLLAEPTLSLWTRAPRTMTASYPTSLPIGEAQLTVTVTYGGQPVARALVAARRTADGVFESAYTDAAGSVTLTLAPAPVSVGPMELTITAHDFLPHEGTINIISPDTPWLTHRSHVIDDTAGGDGDGAANPGETLVMPVTVENVGQVAGAGLSGTLTTSTPAWVTIQDGAAAFPNLAPRESGTTLPDHYRVRVADTAPDNAILGFDLHWTASDGSSGTTSFGESVRAADFAYVSQAIDDSAGNNNGVAGPGETVDLVVTIANVGHRGTSEVHGMLSTSSPYVTILQDEATFGDLPAGAQGPSQPPPFRFRVASSAPDKQPVTFSLLVTEAGGYQESVPFDVMISSCATTPATDVPKPIADQSTVTSTFGYPRTIRINEINVRVDIAHTYIGDLKVSLISPAGTTVVLHNRTGGSTDNIVTWYDTETTPAESLAAFNGQDSFGTWTLKVEDLASGDSGTLNGWALEVCGEALTPSPLLAVASTGVDDAGTCNPDGMADVGETVRMIVRVRNNGTQPATGVVVSLSSPARVAVLSGPASLGTLAVGQERDAVFDVLVGAVSCVESAVFNVTMNANEGAFSDAFIKVLEVDRTDSTSTENLEHGGSAPAGWTHQAVSGTDDWSVRNTKNHTAGGAYSWFVSNTPTTKDDYLYTPTYTLGATSTIDFWHFMDSEAGWDGGVVEITDNDGTSWTDLGPNMTAGVYDRTMSGGPLGSSRSAWTGTYADWKHTVVNLAAWAGKTVKFRFRYVCDSSTARTGWWIDDIVVQTQTDVCDAHACGIPGEVRNVRVARDGNASVLTWWADPVAQRFTVLRSSSCTSAAGFTDVTGEDGNPADASFRDTSTGAFTAWLIVGEGPDGDGPWGHYGQ